MKRLIPFLLAAVLLLGLCAYGRAERASVPEPVPETAFAPDLLFSTTDREGAVYGESIFAGQRLTMINLWEPWCPPCVREMPDLEKLYQDYREQGLLILGVYSTPGMEDEVDAVLTATGVSYPILHSVEALDAFQTGYVPTTIFVDSQGHILRREPDAETLGLLREVGLPNAEELASVTFVGGRPYEGWEAVVLEAFGAED